MTDKEHKRINFQLWYPVVFVALLWVIKWLEYKMGVDMADLGIYPRKIEGLKGVILGPLIHGDIPHLVNNSIPLLIMGVMLFYFYKKSAFQVWITAYLFTGLLVWFFARPSYHIGASGLLYAITSFIFCSGLLRRNKQLIATSLVVAFLYGGMIWGVLPIKEGVSWESHLLGGFVGLALAWVFRNLGPQRKYYKWEVEEDDLEGVEPYWEIKKEVTDITSNSEPYKVLYHYKATIKTEDGKGLEK
ncbi:MAG: membrane associated rhomboid family serine protease [Flavobacteriales bacterium]|jgi:membrane associated rhomboid family serine protease